jgi:hypothetical protein
MKKLTVTAALVALAFVPLRADLTFVQTMTMEGAMAAMAGSQLPKITMRIKGTKARSDIEGPAMSLVSIADIAQNQVIILNATTKTAQVMTPNSTAAGTTPPVVAFEDVSFKPTGKSQTIDGQACDEHLFSMTLNMAEMGAAGGQLPPEAAEMMKDVRMVMNGSIWIAKTAPGAAEYTAYMKSAMQSGTFAALSGMKPGQSGGMDKLMAAAGSAPGLPYLSEIMMTVEGTGPMVDAMKQMGPMKMIQKITSVSTDPISDDLFMIPEGYTIDKK